MLNCRSALTAIGALALASLMIAPAHGAAHLNTNRLTFSGPVALPGVTLPGGTYIFEGLPDTNPDIVVVRSDDRSKVYFMAMTERVDRPKGLSRKSMVTFGES